jgi:hypothetical protein
MCPERSEPFATSDGSLPTSSARRGCEIRTVSIIPVQGRLGRGTSFRNVRAHSVSSSRAGLARLGRYDPVERPAVYGLVQSTRSDNNCGIAQRSPALRSCRRVSTATAVVARPQAQVRHGPIRHAVPFGNVSSQHPASKVNGCYCAFGRSRAEDRAPPFSIAPMASHPRAPSSCAPG